MKCSVAWVFAQNELVDVSYSLLVTGPLIN